MGGNERLRNKASRYAKAAIEFEEKNQMKKAALYYSRAAKTLSQLLKIGGPKNLEEIYEDRIKSYKKRISEILSSTEVKEKRAKSEDTSLEETIVVEKSDLAWRDIGGLDEAKKVLKEASVWPIKRPDIFQGARKPWRGILLFGPPGCGKTLLARAVANEVDATFFNVDSATILSKWFGKSEKQTKKLFNQARAREPSIIYLDEVEAIAGKRTSTEHEAMNRVKTVFLSQMDGIDTTDERIIVIGSTNLPEEIDMAFRRRFEKRIFVPPPDEKGREEILRIHLSETEVSSDVNLREIARKTEGFSGHDLELLVREAAMEPVRDMANKKLLSKKDIQVRKVTMADFEKALKRKKPSLSEKERKRYKKWAEKFAG